MIDSKPLVSIGMPVYNGELYIRQALDSLLAQDYENFELIISDNASTDKTQEICLEYVARDKRIRYYRNQTNMGAAWNANRVFELSSGEYFMWAAHDDFWKPRYLSSCLEAFNISEAIVLAGTECKGIAPETGELILIDKGLSTVGLSPVKRFVRYKSTLHGGRHIGGIFYGVHKRSVLREVMPAKKVMASDHLLMAGLCFQGEFVTVKERLMIKRMGGASASLESIARAHGISNQVLIKGTYLTREFMLQRIIFQTDKLKLPEKIWLVCWSLIHTAVVVFIRLLNLGYQALSTFIKRKVIHRSQTAA
ncbi:MAG: glycosyltransferase [Dehalococcoidia bacterium]|nr:glycosyltransferase [Dehalococcoidia bacterium]